MADKIYVGLRDETGGFSFPGKASIKIVRSQVVETESTPFIKECIKNKVLVKKTKAEFDAYKKEASKEEELKDSSKEDKKASEKSKNESPEPVKKDEKKDVPQVPSAKSSTAGKRVEAPSKNNPKDKG